MRNAEYIIDSVEEKVKNAGTEVRNFVILVFDKMWTQSFKFMREDYMKSGKLIVGTDKLGSNLFSRTERLKRNTIGEMREAGESFLRSAQWYGTSFVIFLISTLVVAFACVAYIMRWGMFAKQ